MDQIKKFGGFVGSEAQKVGEAVSSGVEKIGEEVKKVGDFVGSEATKATDYVGSAAKKAADYVGSDAKKATEVVGTEAFDLAKEVGKDPFQIHHNYEGGNVPFQNALPDKGKVSEDSKSHQAYLQIGSAFNKMSETVGTLFEKGGRVIKEAIPGQKYEIQENKYYPELRERSAKLRKQLGITDESQSIVADFKASLKPDDVFKEGLGVLPHTGRVYLFQDFLGFKELAEQFPRKLLLVSYVDIISVEKTKVAPLFLPTSLIVKTTGDKAYMFVDFLRRIEAYKTLTALVSSALKKEAETTKDLTKVKSFRQSYAEQSLKDLDEVEIGKDEKTAEKGEEEVDDHHDGDDLVDPAGSTPTPAPTAAAPVEGEPKTVESVKEEVTSASLKKPTE